MNIVAKIAQDMNWSISKVTNLIQNASDNYRTFTIPKRRGGFRLISEANSDLCRLQGWLVENILSMLPVSYASTAYSKGNSIKSNAERHKKANFIMHTDIKNFFPSIKFAHLLPILKSNRELFTAKGYTFDMTFLGVIEKICFKAGELCIGTVSSPLVSNIIMYPFDEYMLKFAEKNNLTYTRYADDIYLSSMKYIPVKALDITSRALAQLQFKVNFDKTHFTSRKYRQKITGLVLTDDHKITLGLEMRNKIKKMVYEKLVNDEGEAAVVLGYLSYLKDIEPFTYKKILIKYMTYSKVGVIEDLRAKL